MRKVLIESPYAGNLLQRFLNRRYARMCMLDAFKRGEAPFASHLLYTQPGILRDKIPDERALGINAGLLWGMQAEATIVYLDRGCSNGMNIGIQRAHAANRPIEYRYLGRK